MKNDRSFVFRDGRLARTWELRCEPNQQSNSKERFEDSHAIGEWENDRRSFHAGAKAGSDPQGHGRYSPFH
jgi:hypothetical protein